MDERKYYTIPQVAEYLNIGVQIVRNLIRKKEIPAIRLGYRTIRIDSSKLEEVIKAKTRSQ